MNSSSRIFTLNSTRNSWNGCADVTRCDFTHTVFSYWCSDGNHLGLNWKQAPCGAFSHYSPADAISNFPRHVRAGHWLAKEAHMVKCIPAIVRCTWLLSSFAITPPPPCLVFSRAPSAPSAFHLQEHVWLCFAMPSHTLVFLVTFIINTYIF